MKWLPNWMRFGRRDPEPTRDQKIRAAFETIVRSWESAKGNRLNKNHWSDAKSTGINVDLRFDLQKLRDRCRDEVKNNGILSGMIATNVIDTVGPEGPVLHLSTKNESYRKKALDIWAAWWERPEITGTQSGVELLGEAVGGYWWAGEFFWEFTNDRSAKGVQFRVNSIHPRRILTPPQFAYNRDVRLGIRGTDLGKPLSYFVIDSYENEWDYLLVTQFEEVAAKNIVHDFKRLEPGQARGYPWVAPVLDDVADLRDFDQETISAARAAALLSVLIYTENGENEPINLQGDAPLERQSITALPPGYKAAQVNPAHPSNVYATFHDTKLNTIGRPVCMPLNMVKLDSRQHTYSSARYDGQSYNRSVRHMQRRLGRQALDRCLQQVLTEAQLLGMLPAAPADLEWSWGWTELPEVDPIKEAEGISERIDNGTMTQQLACSHYGLDVEEVRARRVAEGLPPGPSLPPPTTAAVPQPAGAGRG